MMLARKKLLLTVLLSAFFQSGFASADPCHDLIWDAVQWVGNSNPSTTYLVGFNMSIVKAGAKYVGAVSGSFSKVNVAAAGVLASNATAVFSDRAWCPELGAGMLCTNYQPFDYRKQDKMDLLLSSSGGGALRMILKSWGNATFDIPLECKSGFLHGVLVEPNGASMIAMSLKKYKIDVPR